MKNFNLLFLVSLCAMFLYSCESKDAKLKSQILGKFSGNEGDKEMGAEITYNFGRDNSLITYAVFKSPQGQTAKVDIKGTFDIIDGYLFLKFTEIIKSEPEEGKEYFEKQLVGTSEQYKIAALDNEKLDIEKDSKKTTYKRIK